MRSMLACLVILCSVLAPATGTTTALSDRTQGEMAIQAHQTALRAAAQKTAPILARLNSARKQFTGQQAYCQDVASRLARRSAEYAYEMAKYRKESGEISYWRAAWWVAPLGSAAESNAYYLWVQHMDRQDKAYATAQRAAIATEHWRAELTDAAEALGRAEDAMVGVQALYEQSFAEAYGAAYPGASRDLTAAALADARAASEARAERIRSLNIVGKWEWTADGERAGTVEFRAGGSAIFTPTIGAEQPGIWSRGPASIGLTLGGGSAWRLSPLSAMQLLGRLKSGDPIRGPGAILRRMEPEQPQAQDAARPAAQSDV